MAQWLRLDLTGFESVTFFIRMIYKDKLLNQQLTDLATEICTGMRCECD